VKRPGRVLTTTRVPEALCAERGQATSPPNAELRWIVEPEARPNAELGWIVEPEARPREQQPGPASGGRKTAGGV
jgi:hypothetical protein